MPNTASLSPFQIAAYLVAAPDHSELPDGDELLSSMPLIVDLAAASTSSLNAALIIAMRLLARSPELGVHLLRTLALHREIGKTLPENQYFISVVTPALMESATSEKINLFDLN